MSTVSLDGVGIPSAKLLAALYNRSKPQGMGVFAALGAPERMTEAEAWEILEAQGSFDFDYLLGRPLKVRAKDGVIRGIDIRLYDRDNGEGAFEAAVQEALSGD